MARCGQGGIDELASGAHGGWGSKHVMLRASCLWQTCYVDGGQKGHYTSQLTGRRLEEPTWHVRASLRALVYLMS